MRLLVFGAGGFIGRRFIEMFNDKYEIIPIGINFQGEKTDLTSYDEVLALLNNYKPDTVLNLAGKSNHKTQNIAEIYESNLLIQLNLHEGIEQLNLNSKIIFCSSSAVYKSSKELVDEDAGCLPLNTYAKAKYLQEKIGLSYHPKHHVVIARIFNVIGPYQSKSFLIPLVIDQIIRYKKHDISKVKLRTLNAIRDFIFINDVCSAINTLIDKGISGEIYNVCTGMGISLSKVIDILKEILGVSKLALETQDDFVSKGINYQIGSNEKILALGWSPAYDIKKSLKEIIWEEHGN